MTAGRADELLGARELTADEDELDFDEFSDYVTQPLPASSALPRVLAERYAQQGSVDLERWLFSTAWDGSVDPDAMQAVSDQIAPSPLIPDSIFIALLPTRHAWLSPLWLSYYGAQDPDGVVALCAAERHWITTYGAQVVASWETIIQLQFATGPADADSAWALAGQLQALSPDTQVMRWELALALRARIPGPSRVALVIRDDATDLSLPSRRGPGLS